MWVSDIEVVSMQKIKEAYERSTKLDVRYHFRDRYRVYLTKVHFDATGIVAALTVYQAGRSEKPK